MPSSASNKVVTTQSFLSPLNEKQKEHWRLLTPTPKTPQEEAKDRWSQTFDVLKQETPRQYHPWLTTLKNSFIDISKTLEGENYLACLALQTTLMTAFTALLQGDAFSRDKAVIIRDLQYISTAFNNTLAKTEATDLPTVLTAQLKLAQKFKKSLKQIIDLCLGEPRQIAATMQFEIVAKIKQLLENSDIFSQDPSEITKSLDEMQQSLLDQGVMTNLSRLLDFYCPFDRYDYYSPKDDCYSLEGLYKKYLPEIKHFIDNDYHTPVASQACAIEVTKERAHESLQALDELSSHHYYYSPKLMLTPQQLVSLLWQVTKDDSVDALPESLKSLAILPPASLIAIKKAYFIESLALVNQAFENGRFTCTAAELAYTLVATLNPFHHQINIYSIAPSAQHDHFLSSSVELLARQSARIAMYQALLQKTEQEQLQIVATWDKRWPKVTESISLESVPVHKAVYLDVDRPKDNTTPPTAYDPRFLHQWIKTQRKKNQSPTSPATRRPITKRNIKPLAPWYRENQPGLFTKAYDFLSENVIPNCRKILQSSFNIGAEKREAIIAETIDTYPHPVIDDKLKVLINAINNLQDDTHNTNRQMAIAHLKEQVNISDSTLTVQQAYDQLSGDWHRFQIIDTLASDVGGLEKQPQFASRQQALEKLETQINQAYSSARDYTSLHHGFSIKDFKDFDQVGQQILAISDDQHQPIRQAYVDLLKEKANHYYQTIHSQNLAPLKEKLATQWHDLSQLDHIAYKITTAINQYPGTNRHRLQTIHWLKQAIENAYYRLAHGQASTSVQQSLVEETNRIKLAVIKNHKACGKLRFFGHYQPPSRLAAIIEKVYDDCQALISATDQSPKNDHQVVAVQSPCPRL